MQSEESTPAFSLYDVRVTDAGGELVDIAGMRPEELQQIAELMSASAALREAEQKLTDASLRYMKLNSTDMKALHYLIASEGHGQLVTPGELAAHLRISTASTTKLLDRLERAGHVTRGAHPSDRRAAVIAITSETRQAAIATVGKLHAQRFAPAARLSAKERAIVTRYLRETAEALSLEGAEWTRVAEDSGGSSVTEPAGESN